MIQHFKDFYEKCLILISFLPLKITLLFHSLSLIKLHFSRVALKTPAIDWLKQSSKPFVNADPWASCTSRSWSSQSLQKGGCSQVATAMPCGECPAAHPSSYSLPPFLSILSPPPSWDLDTIPWWVIYLSNSPSSADCSLVPSTPSWVALSFLRLSDLSHSSPQFTLEDSPRLSLDFSLFLLHCLHFCFLLVSFLFISPLLPFKTYILLFKAANSIPRPKGKGYSQ